MLWQTPGWRGFPASPYPKQEEAVTSPKSISTRWLSFLPSQYRALKAGEGLMGLPMCVLPDPSPCPVLAELSLSHHLRFYRVPSKTSAARPLFQVQSCLHLGVSGLPPFSLM